MNLTSIQGYLNGKKTYIVAFLLVLVSIVEFLSGDMSLVELLNSENLIILLNGVGLASLRAGVNKVK